MPTAKILFIPEQEWKNTEVQEHESLYNGRSLGKYYTLEGYQLNAIYGLELTFVAHPDGWLK